MSREVRLKYQEFIPTESSRDLEDLENHLEKLAQLILGHTIIASSNFEQNEIRQLGLFYRGLDLVLRTVEKNIQFIPQEIRKSIKYTARSIVDKEEQIREYKVEKDEDINEIENYTRAIINAAKAILWELQKHEDKSNDLAESPTVQSLLEFIEWSPGWQGDDFDECLEYVNNIRG